MQRSWAVAGGVVEMAGAPRAMRPIGLVLEQEQQVVEGVLVELARVEVLRRQTEVRGGRVAETDEATLVGALAVQLCRSHMACVISLALGATLAG